MPFCFLVEVLRVVSKVVAFLWQRTVWKGVEVSSRSCVVPRVGQLGDGCLRCVTPCHSPVCLNSELATDGIFENTHSQTPPVVTEQKRFLDVGISVTLQRTFQKLMNFERHIYQQTYHYEFIEQLYNSQTFLQSLYSTVPSQLQATLIWLMSFSNNFLLQNLIYEINVSFPLIIVLRFLYISSYFHRLQFLLTCIFLLSRETHNLFIPL